MADFRFILFAFDLGDGIGGTQDIRGRYQTYVQAEADVEKMGFDVNQILDLATGQITILEK